MRLFDSGINVVSPCYVPYIFCGTRQGRRTASESRFPRPVRRADTAPLFYAYPGRIFPTIPRSYGTPLRPTAIAYYRRTCGLHPSPAWGRAESVSAACAGRCPAFPATHYIPSFGCGRQVPHRKRPLKSGSRGGLRIEFFEK